MKTKKRLIIPLLICLTVFASVAGGFWYWYDNNVDRSGWKEKDGVRYYRDFHADPVEGWLTLEGVTYLFEPGGIPHTGWLERGEDTYFFDASGAMATGWQVMEDVTYYFGGDGVMTTGWLQLDGNTHYFGGNGAMVDGWLWLDRQYYFRDGIMVTGWQTVDDRQHYFESDGAMVKGFFSVEEDTYYFDSEGVKATGPVWIDGQCYDFQDTGVMFTGWQEAEDGIRYFRQDGTMVIGWEEIEGKRCYFDESGFQRQVGWLEDGEYRYYLQEDGTFATGPKVIDGETHYFTPKGIEVILVNAVNPVPDFYKRELVNVVDYHDVDSRCYDALQEMLSDCEAAGIEYTFNSAYRTLEEQITILEYRTLEHMRDFKLDFEAAREKALDTVAIPGTSEHHLGLAVDLLGAEAIAWLTEHCWDYGFIVRYTEEKEEITGIIDEPWHFRYVGREVSLDMKGSGLCLEEYLGASGVTAEGIEEIHGDRWYREEFTMVNQETIDQYLNPDKTK